MLCCSRLPGREPCYDAGVFYANPAERLAALRFAIPALRAIALADFGKRGRAAANAALLEALAVLPADLLANVANNAGDVARLIEEATQRVGLHATVSAKAVALSQAEMLPALVYGRLAEDVEDDDAIELTRVVVAGLMAGAGETVLAAYCAQEGGIAPARAVEIPPAGRSLLDTIFELLLFDAEWTRRLASGAPEGASRFETAMLALEIELRLKEVCAAVPGTLQRLSERRGDIRDCLLGLPVPKGANGDVDARLAHAEEMISLLPGLYEAEAKSLRAKAALVVARRATPGDLSKQGRCTVYAVALVLAAATSNVFVGAVAAGASAYEGC